MRSSPPSGSFAAPARRAAFITAMHVLADQHRSGPAVVYLSAPQRRQATPGWPRTLERIAGALPGGVWLDTFTDAFPGGPQQYRAHWHDYAADLDGLVVLAEPVAPRTYLLGPGARAEVRSVIAAGQPVLVFTDTDGLIPIVDCKAERTGDSALAALRLTVPHPWLPSAPTLYAALQALSPTTLTHQGPSTVADTPST